MKNVLVANKVLTAIPAGGLETLAKGELIAIKADGTAATAASFKKEDHLHFVVGLGNGNIKNGAYLNGKKLSVVKTPYKADGTKIYTMVLTAVVGDAYRGVDSGINISLIPLGFSKGYPKKVYTAIATVKGGTQTATEHITELKADLDKKVIEINKSYGTGALTVALAGSTLTITGKAGLDFAISCDGQVSSVTTITGTGIYGEGSGKQVSELEKISAVADMGYNPNFSINDSPYGDIFNTDITKNYISYVLITEAERTHPFIFDTKGQTIEQYIAIESTAVVTALDTLLGLSAGGE